MSDKETTADGCIFLVGLFTALFFIAVALWLVLSGGDKPYYPEEYRLRDPEMPSLLEPQ